MGIRSGLFRWIGTAAALVPIALAGCHYRDFITAYEEGASVRQPLTVGDKTYAIDPERSCSEVHVEDSTGTRSWRTGLQIGTITYPWCQHARFTQDGRYVLVPYYRRRSLALNQPALPNFLIVIDLVSEREVERLDIADPEAFSDAFLRSTASGRRRRAGSRR